MLGGAYLVVRHHHHNTPIIHHKIIHHKPKHTFGPNIPMKHIFWGVSGAMNIFVMYHGVGVVFVIYYGDECRGKEKERKIARDERNAR